MTDTRQALAALYKVVIARNRDGADWGEHFGPLMTALAAAKAALSAQRVSGIWPPEPEPSACGLTECKNRTKCDRCKAWDSMGI